MTATGSVSLLFVARRAMRPTIPCMAALSMMGHALMYASILLAQGRWLCTNALAQRAPRCTLPIRRVSGLAKGQDRGLARGEPGTVALIREGVMTGLAFSGDPTVFLHRGGPLSRSKSRDRPSDF